MRLLVSSIRIKSRQLCTAILVPPCLRMLLSRPSASRLPPPFSYGRAWSGAAGTRTARNRHRAVCCSRACTPFPPCPNPGSRGGRAGDPRRIARGRRCAGSPRRPRTASARPPRRPSPWPARHASPRDGTASSKSKHPVWPARDRSHSLSRQSPSTRRQTPDDSTHSAIPPALRHRHPAALLAEVPAVALQDVAATVARRAIALAAVAAALAPPLAMTVPLRTAGTRHGGNSGKPDRRQRHVEQIAPAAHLGHRRCSISPSPITQTPCHPSPVMLSCRGETRAAGEEKGD